jgi:hypothetical protein
MSNLTQPTKEQIKSACRDYKFRLESATADRCYNCLHRAKNNCTLLDIVIANSCKSRCPLFKDDGIPF